MLHSFYVEVFPKAGSKLKVTQVRDKLEGLASRVGGEKMVHHRRQSKLEAKPRPGRVKKMIGLHRFDGSKSKDELLAELEKSVRELGDVNVRIQYHACMHDERKPCQKWQTLVDDR